MINKRRKVKTADTLFKIYNQITNEYTQISYDNNIYKFMMNFYC